MEIFLIEMVVYDSNIAGEKTLYFSTADYTSPPPDNQYYMPRILQPSNYQTSMFQSGKTSGASSIGFGEVRLINSDGVLDYLLDYGIDGRSIVFKKLMVLGVTVLLASCSMEQPEFTNEEIVIRVKDPKMVLNVPIQPNKYTGANELPNGIEGTDDIKGTPKPLVYGSVYNISPVLVNASKLIYQVNDGAATTIKVYDKGVSIIKDKTHTFAIYTDLEDMENYAPHPGTYRYCPSLGCFRLGSSPVGQITADVVEGDTSADRTKAQIAKKIALRVITSNNINSTDVSNLDTIDNSEMGIYIKDETTIMAVLDEILQGSWYGFDINSKLRMQQFSAPSGAPEIVLTKNQYLSMDRIASNDTCRGIPTHKVNLNYLKNYTIQSDNSLAACLPYTWDTWDEVDVIYNKNYYIGAFGNGTFVFISTDGSVLRSSDGIFWGSWPSLSPHIAYSNITYGNDHFSIIGFDSNLYYTSPEGLYWTAHTLPSFQSWNSIAFGNGIYVATTYGYSGVYATSTDGINWTQRTLSTNSSWRKMAFVNGFFIITSGGNSILKSSDGLNWDQITFSDSATYENILYGNGLYILQTPGTSYYVTSVDAVNWIRRSIPFDAYWGAMCYGDGTFFILSGDDYISATSTDGINWHFKEVKINVVDSVFGNGMFISRPAATSQYFNILQMKNMRGIFVAKEYRTVSVNNSSTLMSHLLAPEMNVNTLLVDGLDATNEASRLLNLYEVRRDTLLVTVSTQVLSYINLGSIIEIVSDRYGYDNGKLFCVIGVTVDWATGILTMTLWG